MSKVYLVGVGPGDPGLLTLKAVRAIENADCIVYDRLISKSILNWASKDVELIYAGKEADKHTLTQDEINAVLVKKALEGKVTVRLKGGDPFVFGRGGEEAEELLKYDIPFEIIPGITSAISVPMYAGIPVTHRDFCSSLHIITGHERPDKENSFLDYALLAKLTGTLVFLMGVSNLDNICNALISNGKDENTMVAVIENGTTNKQRVTTGSLKTIYKNSIENSVKSPAIIVVGDVVKLSEKLSWFKKGVLAGKRVLVTRTREQASNLSKKLEDLGAEVIEYPLIKTEHVDDYTRLDESIKDPKKYKWLVFTSVNGVRYFFERLNFLELDIRDWAGVNFCAVGKATKEALAEKNIKTMVVPENYTTKELLDELKKVVKDDDRVLMLRSNMADKELFEGLRPCCKEVDDVVTYKTLLVGKENKNELDRYLREGIDYITFASSSAVKSFSEIVDVGDNGNLDAVCIGPVTYKEAEKVGFKSLYMANTYTIDGLIEKLVSIVNE